LGKALGGASGGYVSARKEIVDMLRQRSRPYVFSNTVAPASVGASLTVLDLVTRTKDLWDLECMSFASRMAHIRSPMSIA
jgi:glycine C-acetyltransferase